jgi:large subunit ribosomal protein L4
MQVSIYNTSAHIVGSMDLDDSVFAVAMNQALVHQVAIGHRANQRQGNASTKTRTHVAGGGAKPWRQKHTGRARQGSTRSPQWRGGGVVFGPHPRDYSQRIPKKMNRGAIRCLLSDKAVEGKLVVLDNFQLDQVKTRYMVDILAKLSPNASALIVTNVPDHDVVLAARNIPKVKTIPASQTNVLDLMKYEQLIMTVEAINRIVELWAIHNPTPVDEEPLEAKD